MLPRHLEEMTLNHWQPLSTEIYDGWVLRFAGGYTKRANSIQAIYPSLLPVEEKIVACEELYEERGLRPVYKITPFAQPVELDGLLQDRGYTILEPSSVQTVGLSRLAPPVLQSASIQEQLTPAWIDLYCCFNCVDPRHKPTMTGMLSHIGAATGYLTLYHDGQAIGCGLGILSGGYIGLYDIVVDSRFRNQGIGEQLILHLLQWGKARGATHSYLAVVKANAPALALYSKLGYKEIYSYWYRAKVAREH
ncbi:GNAT family N-acetyltransferase [Paenibacillus sp. 1P07SE]|uniref:GNAT family N-acetyltransferase n=1 Tax=Paenibacillus sp. 1P07SE TaxID=3132209 RepID=UPI0039A5C5DC